MKVGKTFTIDDFLLEELKKEARILRISESKCVNQLLLLLLSPEFRTKRVISSMLELKAELVKLGSSVELVIKKPDWEYWEKEKERNKLDDDRKAKQEFSQQLEKIEENP